MSLKYFFLNCSGMSSASVHIFSHPHFSLSLSLHHRYPNPADPLNGEAAAMLLRDPAGFEARVKEYVRRFATTPASAIGASPQAPTIPGSQGRESDEVSSMAAYSSADDDDVNGLEL